MNEIYNYSHQQKTSCTFLYIPKAKNCETFIYKYKKPATLQKARQFALSFYSQKSRHFTLRGFHENFQIGIFIYTKSMIFCAT